MSLIAIRRLLRYFFDYAAVVGLMMRCGGVIMEVILHRRVQGVKLGSSTETRIHHVWVGALPVDEWRTVPACIWNWLDFVDFGFISSLRCLHHEEVHLTLGLGP